MPANLVFSQLLSFSFVREAIQDWLLAPYSLPGKARMKLLSCQPVKTLPINVYPLLSLPKLGLISFILLSAFLHKCLRLCDWLDDVDAHCSIVLKVKYIVHLKKN